MKSEYRNNACFHHIARLINIFSPNIAYKKWKYKKYFYIFILNLKHNIWFSQFCWRIKYIKNVLNLNIGSLLDTCNINIIFSLTITDLYTPTGETLGNGATASVKTYKCKSTQKEYAVKVRVNCVVFILVI